MSAYLLIRVLLLLALAVIAWWLTRPVSSASSLAMRRIGIGALVAAAVVAILVPSLANRLAHVIGVDRSDGHRLPARSAHGGTCGGARACASAGGGASS